MNLHSGPIFGGSAGEGIRDIECDRVGNIYLAGTTHSPKFPSTASVYDNAVDASMGKASQIGR
jgi:hypothetical protein